MHVVCAFVPVADTSFIKGDKVLKEISSSPKSLPLAVELRLTILITAFVVLPEFQVGLL